MGFQRDEIDRQCLTAERFADWWTWQVAQWEWADTARSYVACTQARTVTP